MSEDLEDIFSTTLDKTEQQDKLPLQTQTTGVAKATFYEKIEEDEDEDKKSGDDEAEEDEEEVHIKQ